MVKKEEGEKKAQEHELIFIEASAKTGENVQNVFRQIATLLTGSDPTQQFTTQQTQPDQSFANQETPTQSKV